MIAGKLDRASLHKICAYRRLPSGRCGGVEIFSPVSSSGKLSLRHPLNKLGGEFFFDETFGDDAARCLPNTPPVTAHAQQSGRPISLSAAGW
jgi:hypothetical protein